MDFQTIIGNLTEAQKTELVEMLLADSEAPESDQSLGYPSECVHCGHKGIVRNGSIRGKARFKCKDCSRTFSHDAFKLRFQSGKSAAHWKRYLQLMFDGFSLRKIRDRMNDSGLYISLGTSFTWRHKVLTVLRQATRTSLNGHVEADETYLRLSFKGRLEDLGRAPHKRGMSATKRGLSDELVCISTGADRKGGYYLKPVTLGQMSIADFRSNLARHIDWENTTFLTDGHKSYVPPDDHRITHIRIKGHGRGAHHINTVNNCHSQLKDFLKPFRGVATKYLDNYLAFWQWLKLDRSTAIRETRGWIAWDTLRNMEMTLK